MKNVYILTKEGKAFSDEGCDFIRDMIKSRFDDKSDLIFSMGDDYNNPERLSFELKTNPDSYIVISNRFNDRKSIDLIYGGNIEATIKLLSLNPGKRAWDVIAQELENMNQP